MSSKKICVSGIDCLPHVPVFLILISHIEKAHLFDNAH